MARSPSRPATTGRAGGNLTLTSGTLTTGTLAAQGDISIAAAFTGGTTTLLINGTTPQTWSGTSNGPTDTLLVVNINDPASTLTITASLRTTRNWTFTASGGLTASASSIIFAGGTITGTHTLGAVEIAGAVTIAGAATVSVPGNLTLTSGTLTTGTLAAQGNISIATAFTGGTTTLLINGTTPQTWSGSANGAADTLLVVNINDPTSTLTITASLRTTRNWTFTASGGLTAAASSIIFAGGTITGTHTLGAVEIAGAVIDGCRHDPDRTGHPDADQRLAQPGWTHRHPGRPRRHHGHGRLRRRRKRHAADQRLHPPDPERPAEQRRGVIAERRDGQRGRRPDGQRHAAHGP